MTFEMTDELKEQFTELAYEKTEPFCYGCYHVVKANVNKEYFCPTCGSDDLMRHMEGVGVEWGISWVIEHLIEVECEKIEFEDNQYDEMLDDCHPIVTIGSSTFYPSTILKECDPICYEMGKDEYFDGNAEEKLESGEWIKCNDSYYTPDCLVAA
jgi:predicted RNA-binding Zn-ribbon protein involved in translation (DUF1610 family)